MKRFYLCMVFLLFMKFTFSQAYNPIIELNKFWDQSDIDAYTFCTFEAARYEFTDEDTVVNNFTYRICKDYHLIGVPGPGMMTCQPFVADTNSVRFVGLREDTTTRKVYIYTPDFSPTDQLLYDFNLNVGDTLKSVYAGNGEIIILESITVVTLQNGQTRKKFNFNEGAYIEGIGGVNGLFHDMLYALGYPHSLYCVKKDGEDIWGQICNTVFLNLKNDHDLPISVYPNPATDIIKINFNYISHSQPILFKVYDIHGTEVLAKRLKPSNNTISIVNLQPGFYFYHIQTGKILHQGKLVKL